ncbi:MAG: macro domain-containing protein, partial [Desulfosporosinus sp.]
VIASSTLNGKFINQKVNDIDALNTLIKDDIYMQERIIEKNIIRKNGKAVRYKLGSVLLYNQEYLLTAFSRFDDQNKAYLSMPDYLEFLVNFWSDVDRVYAGRSVTIPLFGSGITRFRGYDMINDQELLEILIWSFKISRIKFTHPAKVTILIHPDKKDRINFYDLKGGDCSVL